MYYTQNSMSNANPQHQLNPMQQTASSLTHSTPDSQPYSTLQAPFSMDLSSADALEELLQQVGLSSTNLLATPEQCENRPVLDRPPPQPWDPTQAKRAETKQTRKGERAKTAKREIPKSNLAYDGENPDTSDDE